MSTTKPTDFYSNCPILATIPVLDWKIIDTLQGACFEFPDGRHDWPSPREQQIIEAFQPRIAELEAALRAMRTQFYAHDCLNNADCRKCKALNEVDRVLNPEQKG